MKNYIYIFITGFLFFQNLVFGQNEPPLELPDRYRYVGINTTPLLVQFIPFNRSNPKVTGPYFINYRSYNPKGKAFKMAFGISLEDAAEDGKESFLNFQIGYERRRMIFNRWAYTTGWSLFLVGGDLNIPGSKDDDSGKLGFGPTWSLEYNLNPFVSLSMEMGLLIGMRLELGEPTAEFIPPVALYLNVRHPKNKRRKRK